MYKVYLAVFSLFCVVFSFNVYAEEPYCREFTQTFTIGNESQEGYGRACLQEDGSWKIVSQNKAAFDAEMANSSEVAMDRQNDVQYITKEEEIYVVPRVVIFAPGHKWHRRSVRHRHHHRWHW